MRVFICFTGSLHSSIFQLIRLVYVCKHELKLTSTYNNCRDLAVYFAANTVHHVSQMQSAQTGISRKYTNAFILHLGKP